MAKIIIYRLPKSTDDEILKVQSRPMRLARLRSLLTDPTHFCSKYNDEVEQKEEFWISRLRPAYVHHFVAVTIGDNQDDHFRPVDESTLFQGFMVVTNEHEKNQNMQQRLEEHADGKTEIPTYSMDAFYVDESLRSQGVGSRMIRDSIEWIIGDAKSNGLLHVKYRVTAIVENARAINLYIKHGFKVDQTSKQNGIPDGIHTELAMMIDVEKFSSNS